MASGTCEVTELALTYDLADLSAPGQQWWCVKPLDWAQCLVSAVQHDPEHIACSWQWPDILVPLPVRDAARDTQQKCGIKKILARSFILYLLCLYLERHFSDYSKPKHLFNMLNIQISKMHKIQISCISFLQSLRRVVWRWSWQLLTLQALETKSTTTTGGFSNSWIIKSSYLSSLLPYFTKTYFSLVTLQNCIFSSGLHQCI